MRTGLASFNLEALADPDAAAPLLRAARTVRVEMLQSFGLYNPSSVIGLLAEAVAQHIKAGRVREAEAPVSIVGKSLAAALKALGLRRDFICH